MCNMVLSRVCVGGGVGYGVEIRVHMLGLPYKVSQTEWLEKMYSFVEARSPKSQN